MERVPEPRLPQVVLGRATPQGKWHVVKHTLTGPMSLCGRSLTVNAVFETAERTALGVRPVDVWCADCIRIGWPS